MPWVWWAVAVAVGAGALFWGLRQWWVTRITVIGAGWEWSVELQTRWGWFHSTAHWPIKLKMPDMASNKSGSMFDPRQVALGVWLLGVFRRWVEVLWERIVIQDFQAVVRLGVGDAAATALTLGWLHALVGTWMTRRILPKANRDTAWELQPFWNQRAINVQFQGEFRIRGTALAGALLSAMAVGWKSAVKTAVRRRRLWNYKATQA